MMKQEARRIEKVYELLVSQSTLVLATRDEQGMVHAAPLFYLVQENLDLYWLSSADGLHSWNVVTVPHVAVAVYRSTFEWRKIMGVQMRGVCGVVDGPERAGMVDAYRERFELNSVLAFAIGRSTLYRFRPQWVRYIDNHERLGYRFELSFADGRTSG
jgi:uncharacterized protein YhbP (UPF0306 family)